MQNIIFKIIKKFPPEISHNLTLKLLQLNLGQKKFLDNPILYQHIFGYDFSNPIGIAAGFDKNAEVYNQLYKVGFGFVEVGTITPLSQYGNPKPRVFRLVDDEALINRLGFNNHGAQNILDRIKRNSKIGILGINIGPNKDTLNRLEDYLSGLRYFYKVADYITINISSPNT